MPHIHTEDNQHDLTVTGYIVRIDGDEPRALVHMHRKLNVLLPIGGHVELHETPWQSIAHELNEEAGYRLEQLEILQPISRLKHMSNVAQHPYPIATNTHDIPDNHFHTDIEYAFVTKELPADAIAEGESIDMRWMTLDELRNAPEGSLFSNTLEVYEFIIEEALHAWELVKTDTFSLN